VNIIEAAALGIIQGLTEFIPVSSSGHLLLTQYALGVEGSGLAFDVALHIGTLFALILFFHKDIIHLVYGILGKNESKQLAWLIVLATIPAVIGGYALQSTAETTFRSPWIVSFNLIAVAILMLLAEKYAAKRKQKSLDQIKWKQAISVGFAQVIALVPGVSRSGITITAGIFSGLDRVSATRFSFLLAIPITFGAVLKVTSDSSFTTQVSNEKAVFLVGIVAAFASGLFAIKFLISYLSKHSLAVFAYYRIALGIITIILLAR